MKVSEQYTVVKISQRKRRRSVTAELYAALEAVLPFAEDEVDALHWYPSGEPHLFPGRNSFDDGTTCVLISEERPWRGFGGRRRNGWG